MKSTFQVEASKLPYCGSPEELALPTNRADILYSSMFTVAALLKINALANSIGNNPSMKITQHTMAKLFCAIAIEAERAIEALGYDDMELFKDFKHTVEKEIQAKQN